MRSFITTLVIVYAGVYLYYHINKPILDTEGRRLSLTDTNIVMVGDWMHKYTEKVIAGALCHHDKNVVYFGHDEACCYYHMYEVTKRGRIEHFLKTKNESLELKGPSAMRINDVVGLIPETRFIYDQHTLVINFFTSEDKGWMRRMYNSPWSSEFDNLYDHPYDITVVFVCLDDWNCGDIWAPYEKAMGYLTKMIGNFPAPRIHIIDPKTLMDADYLLKNKIRWEIENEETEDPRWTTFVLRILLEKMTFDDSVSHSLRKLLSGRAFRNAKVIKTTN